MGFDVSGIVCDRWPMAAREECFDPNGGDFVLDRGDFVLDGEGLTNERVEMGEDRTGIRDDG